MIVQGPILSVVVDVLTRAVVAGSGVAGTAALLLFLPAYAIRIVAAVIIVGAVVLTLVLLQSVLVTLFALAVLVALASLPVRVDRPGSVSADGPEAATAER